IAGEDGELGGEAVGQAVESGAGLPLGGPRTRRSGGVRLVRGQFLGADRGPRVRLGLGIGIGIQPFEGGYSSTRCKQINVIAVIWGKYERPDKVTVARIRSKSVLTVQTQDNEQ